jgi:hypothetical protein
VITGSKFQLEDWEYVTCMKHLYLSSEGMHRQDSLTNFVQSFQYLSGIRPDIQQVKSGIRTDIKSGIRTGYQKCRIIRQDTCIRLAEYLVHP